MSNKKGVKRKINIYILIKDNVQIPFSAFCNKLAGFYHLVKLAPPVKFAHILCVVFFLVFPSFTLKICAEDIKYMRKKCCYAAKGKKSTRTLNMLQ